MTECPAADKAGRDTSGHSTDGTTAPKQSPPTAIPPRTPQQTSQRQTKRLRMDFIRIGCLSLCESSKTCVRCKTISPGLFEHLEADPSMQGGGTGHCTLEPSVPSVGAGAHSRRAEKKPCRRVVHCHREHRQGTLKGAKGPVDRRPPSKRDPWSTSNPSFHLSAPPPGGVADPTLVFLREGDSSLACNCLFLQSSVSANGTQAPLPAWRNCATNPFLDRQRHCVSESSPAGRQLADVSS